MNVAKVRFDLTNSDICRDEERKANHISTEKNTNAAIWSKGNSDVEEYLVDERFERYFSRLKQVFMYITDRCNIACAQCIYKPSVNHFIREEIELTEAVGLLKSFRTLGASKLTLLGGEPTLYGYKEKRKPLLRLIESAKNIGYTYIRLDTNGQSISDLLDMPGFSLIDEIAFSIDGFNAALNDSLRGEGTFDRAIFSLRKAVKLGYNTSITCCAHERLLTKEPIDGTYLIEKMIRFGERLGVTEVNFHDLFKTGVPMDTWTGEFSPDPVDWVAMYSEVSKKIEVGSFSVGVRLPQCFISMDEFNRNPGYYGFCPVKLGERVMIHPNGTIRICSNLICTGFGVGRYEPGKIVWDDSHNNETDGHELAKNTPCTNRSRHRSYRGLVPLCFSFKPHQSEYVWSALLDWDARRKNDRG
jgi:MoaA/NifB/PqqE/SkfB family radical SAM enzyme